MSEEVIDVETKTEEVQQMYVQTIDWETFISVIDRITNVNRLYMYNMPTKAEKYCEDIASALQINCSSLPAT